MPKPDDEVRGHAKDRVSELKKVRDQAHKDAEAAKAAADEEMWKGIAAELNGGQLLQVDVAEVTEFNREHIRQRTKPYRS